MGSPRSDDDRTRPGWPAPWQGGWPPPGQQGQYPPPGPGGPYPPQGLGGGPSAPPPPDGRSGRGLLIAVVVGLVVLAGLAVALDIAFTRVDGKTLAADPSPPTGPSETAGQAPSSSASPSPTESSAAASSSPAADRTEELLATVPADFPDCEAGELAGDGDVAAVVCGPSTTRPGPQDGAFHLYDDTGTLDRVFAEDTSALDPLPAGEDCSTAQGVTTWHVEGVEGGEVACTITEDGLLLAWTDREFDVEGIVTAPGSTQEELAALAEWWSTHSGYQG